MTRSHHQSGHAEFIAWAAEGHKDSMGLPFSDWLVCVDGPDGRAIRGRDGLIVYETQAEWLARNGALGANPAVPAQLGLFA